jgi:hypothetical protein
LPLIGSGKKGPADFTFFTVKANENTFLKLDFVPMTWTFPIFSWSLNPSHHWPPWSKHCCIVSWENASRIGHWCQHAGRVNPFCQCSHARRLITLSLPRRPSPMAQYVWRCDLMRSEKQCHGRSHGIK